MSNIVINKIDGGLGRVVSGTDAISALLFYLPSVASWSAPRLIANLEEAETAGILDEGTLAVAHYHISEFFRMAPGATLYVHIVEQPADSNTFAEVQTLIDFSEGTLRQIGVYTTAAFATTDVVTLQSMASASELANTPVSAIVYAADISTITDPTTLPNLRGTAEGAPNAPKVSIIIAQDGAGKGAQIYGTLQKSVTALGCCLGTIASAAVNENIGWIKKFNISNGAEMEVVALSNGRLRPAYALVETLTTRGYICAYKEVDIAGSYFSDSPTACPATSDYAYIEANRTMDKAIRSVRAALLPELKGTVYIDPASGQMRADTVAYLEEVCNAPLAAMDEAGELSGYEVYIDPDQKILQSGELVIEIRNVPTGIVRKFIVNIGYTTKLD